jgi:Arc/MetJ family transcription regulator
MARTTVNVDPGLLEEAQEALGTKGLTATVHAALAAAVRRKQLARFDVREFEVTDRDIEEARRDRLASS